MSARTFWGIFTVTIIILAEIVITRPALNWMLREELVARNLPYSMFFTVDAKHPDRPVIKADFRNERVDQLTDKLYKIDPARTVHLVISLILGVALIGFLFASITFRHLVSFGDRLNKLSLMDKLAMFVGVVIGILLSGVVMPIIPGDSPIVKTLVGLLITYLCVWLMATMKDEVKFYFPNLNRSQEFEKAFQKPKILDTNVIIDGRVADVCNTGFVEGQIFVPSFVLDELQHIADSGDSMRRARGRRGLDILNQMRKELGLDVKQCNPVDPENPEEVDARLVKLAKQIDGVIVTNDFNLNKVAELQGVPVLNVNELANALKPVVLPGEALTVNIVKEGKEINQGIAYLEDGTMIVVEGARKHIGETVEAIVASVLQTVAGKMIFANLKANQEEEDAIIDRNVRNYSSIRPRRKTV